MSRLLSLCCLAALSACELRAGPTESAIMAAMRLSEQRSYTWIATVEDDARVYDIVGKTGDSGFTRVKMPIINTVRRRLGRSVTDTEIEAIFRGNVACVLATERGWMSPDEIPEPESDSAPGANLALTGHGALPTGIMNGLLIERRPAKPPEKPERRYSNLQLAISPPHEELGIIVGSHQELRAEADTVSGTLTDLGAQLLLVRDGQKDITPLQASGTFKLWLRDGFVTRYQVKLEGTLAIQSRNGPRQVQVFQTTTTVVKDIGTTEVDVPDEARLKLLR